MQIICIKTKVHLSNVIYSSILDYIDKAYLDVFKVECSLTLSSREKLRAEWTGGHNVHVPLYTQPGAQ